MRGQAGNPALHLQQLANMDTGMALSSPSLLRKGKPVACRWGGEMCRLRVRLASNTLALFTLQLSHNYTADQNWGEGVCS